MYPPTSLPSVLTSPVIWYSSVRVNTALLSSTPNSQPVEGGYVSVFNKIFVEPDPSTLTKPIADGNIYAFTHRKRRNADDKMLISSPVPSGSKFAETPSGEGFIIPNDMTATQKRNVLTIINQLKSQNTLLGD